MNQTAKVAIAGFSGLHAQALFHIVRDSAFTPVLLDVTAIENDSLLDTFDVFILSAELFISRLDFFLPRKQRVAVVFDGENLGCSLPIVRLDFAEQPESISEKIRNMVRPLLSPDPLEGHLTLRELDVLKEIASGKTNKEIADVLNISVNTAITHRKNITRKLGIRSVSGLSLYALMNGLIDMSGSE